MSLFACKDNISGCQFVSGGLLERGSFRAGHSDKDVAGLHGLMPGIFKL